MCCASDEDFDQAMLGGAISKIMALIQKSGRPADIPHLKKETCFMNVPELVSFADDLIAKRKILLETLPNEKDTAEILELIQKKSASLKSTIF